MADEPLRLDVVKRREICRILGVGGTRSMAAMYVGCTTETIRAVARQDPDFATELHKAELDAEIKLLEAIRDAAKDVKQWRAAAWALERLFPERYGNRPIES